MRWTQERPYCTQIWWKGGARLLTVYEALSLMIGFATLIVMLMNNKKK
ncbi:putative holin-like toxin [Streptococcus constellatus]